MRLSDDVFLAVDDVDAGFQGEGGGVKASYPCRDTSVEVVDGQHACVGDGSLVDAGSYALLCVVSSVIECERSGLVVAVAVVVPYNIFKTSLKVSK